MHRTLALSALLLTAAGTAVALQHDDPQGPTGIEQSTCWTCHAPGLWDPPMQEAAYAFRVSDTGTGTRLELRAENTWTHDLDDLRAVAYPPSGWTFGADGNQTRTAYDATVGYTPGNASEAWLAFEVPAGTQGLGVSLEDRSMFDHALRAEIHGPDRHWMLGTVHAGDAAAYDVETIAAAGWDTYHARIVRDGAPGDVPEDAAITLHVTTHDRPERGMLVAATQGAAPGESAVLSWPVAAEADAAPGAWEIDVFYTSSYAHESEQDPDRASIRASTGTSLALHDGGIALASTDAETPPDAQASSPGIVAGLAAVGALVLRRARDG